MGSVSGWLHRGGEKCLAADVRREGSSWQFGYPANTLAPNRYLYSRRQHLPTRELRSLKEAGSRIRTEHFSVLASISNLSYCRVAVIVPKYGHIIVERNRLRRRLRELVRIDLLPKCTNVDLVLQALPPAYRADFNVLGAEVRTVVERLSSTFQSI